MLTVNFDYSLDTMKVDGTIYPLKPLRQYLSREHPELLEGHFIKAIRSGGKTKFTFDWDTIYFKANEYGYIKNYLHEIL